MDRWTNLEVDRRQQHEVAPAGKEALNSGAPEVKREQERLVEEEPAVVNPLDSEEGTVVERVTRFYEQFLPSKLVS
jgi:hypothetical protein